MKRHLVLFLALMLTVGTGAQDTRKLKTISLTTDVNVTFEKNEVDSVVAVLDAAGDTLGVKVYCAGAKGERDFLRRYITRITWWENAPIVPPEGNTNRNSTADLKKNREGWRLEFPRFYQGTNQTYEHNAFHTQLWYYLFAGVGRHAQGQPLDLLRALRRKYAEKREPAKRFPRGFSPAGRLPFDA